MKALAPSGAIFFVPVQREKIVSFCGLLFTRKKAVFHVKHDNAANRDTKKIPSRLQREPQTQKNLHVWPGQTDTSTGKKACVSPRLRAARPAGQRRPAREGRNFQRIF